MRIISCLLHHLLIWIVLLFIAVMGNNLYDDIGSTDTLIILYVFSSILILFGVICSITLFVKNTVIYIYCFAFPCIINITAGLIVGLMGYYHIPSGIAWSYIVVMITICTLFIVRTTPCRDEDISRYRSRVSHNTPQRTSSEMNHD